MNQLNPFFMNSWMLFPLILWTVFWKGVSLWVAVKNNQKIWFVVLLVLNTFGFLEIIYFFFVSKKKWVDLKEIFSKTTPPQS